MEEIPGIPNSIVRGIKSKSKKVHRQFPITEKADLIQDGYVLVLQILKKRPEASPQYLMTALKRFYGAKKRRAYDDTVRRVSLTDEVLERHASGSYHIDREIDEKKERRIAEEEADSGASKFAITVLTKEYGLNHKEVVGLIGKDARDENQKGKRG